MAHTRADPTRTTTLRQRYVRAMRKRFNKVRSLVIRAVGDLDVFGLNPRQNAIFNNFVSNQLPERQAFRFMTDSQKIEAFNSWFQEQVDAEILSVDVKGDPWTAEYVNPAYRQGSVRAYTDAHADELSDTPDFYCGRRSQFLETAFTGFMPLAGGVACAAFLILQLIAFLHGAHMGIIGRALHHLAAAGRERAQPPLMGNRFL